MKLAVLIIANVLFCGQSRAADAIWIHGALDAGVVNKDVNPTEYWNEIHISNPSVEAKRLIVDVRRWNGSLVIHQDFTVDGGAEKTIKIEDPDTAVTSVDEFGGNLRELLRVAAVVRAVGDDEHSTLIVTARSFRLHGDQLKTWDLGPVRRDAVYAEVRALPLDSTSLVTNTSDAPRSALFCAGTRFSGCVSPTVRLDVPAFATKKIELPGSTPSSMPNVEDMDAMSIISLNGIKRDLSVSPVQQLLRDHPELLKDQPVVPQVYASGATVLLVNSPPELLLTYYIHKDGVTSNFNVQSGISYGPVKDH